tara:strand:+ start:147 stop:881 length:735 start_codon:yes stop_codon:yes gene_type:complete
MILIGDIGNTDTKICIVSLDYKIKKKFVFSTKNFNKINFLKKINNFKIKKSLFSSVVPEQFFKISLILKKKYKIKTLELKNLNLNKIIKIKVNRMQVGSDRLANSIGVMTKKNNFIIIDFGTATTFDVVVKNEYNGGVIAPGILLSLNTLVKKATLIPKINLKKVTKVIGKNTSSAVRSGFFWGYIGLIDNIVQLIKKESNRNFKIVITGGFAKLFKKSLRFKFTIDENITIKGLIKTAKLIDF